MGEKAPNKASMMGAFSSSDTYRMKSPTFSIFVRLATRSGKSFMAGFGIGWKIRLAHPSMEAQRMMLKLANDYEVISS